MEKFKIYKIKYLPATTTMGDRVKVTSLAIGDKFSVTEPANYYLTPLKQAEEILKKNKHSPIGFTYGDSCDYIIVAD